MVVRELQSLRLELRPCERDDLQALLGLWTEHEVRHWFFDGRVVSAREVESAVEASHVAFSETGVGIWSVFLRDTGAFVGAVGLLGSAHPFFDSEIDFGKEAATELCFAIVPEYRRNGYSTEAASAILDYGFEVAGMEKVVAIADEPNTGSAEVLRRCAMSKTGSLSIGGQMIHLFSRMRGDSTPGGETR